MKGDLGKAFGNLMNAMFIKYEGCTIERIIGGYRVFGKDYKTLDEAKAAVDQRFILFSNIIKQQNNLL